MKKYSAVLAAAMWLLMSVAVMAADGGPPCAVEIHMLKASSDACNLHIIDPAELRRRLAAGELQDLESYTANGCMNDYISILVGGKYPISYADPRAGGFQVQYVDTGLKMNLQVAPSGDRLRVDASVDRVALVDPAATYSSQDGVIATSTMLLKSGQTGVIMSTRGRLTAQFLKRSYPKVSLSENDTILIAVSVRKL